MYYSDLRRQFPGIRLQKIITATESSELSLAELIVYSILRWVKRPVSINRLSVRSGMTRRTIKAILIRLESYNLAAIKDGRWSAILPDENTAKWFSVVGYWWLGKPLKKSPLTWNQSAVFWLINSISMQKKWYNRRYLQKIARCSKFGLAKMLARLRANGLLTADDSPVFDESIPAHFLCRRRWMPKINVPDSASTDKNLKLQFDNLQRFANRATKDMYKAGYPDRVAEECIDLVVYGGRTVEAVNDFFLGSWSKMLNQAQTEHAKNQKEGKYIHARNSGGLLKRLLTASTDTWKTKQGII